MADLEVQTIAQRRAAKRSVAQSYPTQSISIPSDNSNQSDSLLIKETIPSTQPPQLSSPEMINRETLLAMAKSMGLELRPEKKVWIKHSYSVTQQSKEKFSQYCDTLGQKMQDALDDALNDWFTKHKTEFEAILKVKE